MASRTQTRSPETDPGALLGDELRQARIIAGYRSQDDVAALAGTDRSVIGRIETGERPPGPEILATLLDLYRIANRLRVVYERLALLARARSGESPVKMWFAGYLKAEMAAQALRFWSPVIFPGLAQTENYARWIFTMMGLDEDEVAEQVSVRMKRQEILSHDDPPSVIIVLWEPVLHHLIGSPEVMRGQLAQLLDLSRKVVVQIVPSKLGGNAGLGGAIALAARPGVPEILLSGSLIEDAVTQDEDQVRRASVTFDQVRADALPRAESRELIEKALETWNQ